jgi:nucleotide-binding universal stress UspA family protein
MFRKILYPTDFSDRSKKTMAYMKQLKDAGTEDVVLLHVVDTRKLHMPDIYNIFPDLSLLGEKQASEAAEQAQHMAKQLNDIGIRTIIRIEKGIPFKEILRVESEEAVSLIVIGSHGINNVEEMLLGSVSEKVIRKAKGPVLVVR